MEKQSKLQKYNQRLMAIVGTLFLLVLLIVLIAILNEIIDDFFPDDTRPYASVLSEENTKALTSENLVVQQVHYSRPILIDSASMLFVIPVHNEILDKSKNRSFMDLIGFYEANVDEVLFESRSIYSSDFNNLILWDYNTNTKQVLLNNRMAAGRLTRIHVDNKRYIAFVSADTDSNKDGYINTNDKISLYIYSLDLHKLRKVSYNQASLLSFEYLKGRNEIILQFTKEQQGLKQESNKKSPSFFMLYDYEKDSMTPIIDSEIEQKMKKMYE